MESQGIPQGTNDKREALKQQLAGLGKLAVAFSGGVDSSLLLSAAVHALGAENVVAVTVESELAPAFEMQRAQWLCEDLGIRQLVVHADPLSLEGVRENGEKRCYHCKGNLFALALEAARAEGFEALADGTNADDASDYRPGARALAELGVASPLRDAGLTKQDIRHLAREDGLGIWDAPSCACLATRVEYGQPLDADLLARIDAAEDYLRKLDIEQVRVRVHGDIARIEVGASQIARMAEPALRMDVAMKMYELGFAYVCLDLEGFRSGSMNARVAKAAGANDVNGGCDAQ